MSRKGPGAALARLAALSLLATAATVEAEPYQPGEKVSGVIRSFGFGLGGVYLKWQEAFRRHQPDVTFENSLPTSDAAFPALVTRVTDLGPNGGEPAIVEALSFFETHGYHASYVTVASGSFDQEGRSNGPVVFVHKSNPLRQLTVDQLDGIFGSERSGGLRGFEWTEKGARGPERDIRTWRQLGVTTGPCADRPIKTYGHGPSGTTRFFQLNVLAGSDKWNANYRGYVESGSKQLPPDERPAGRLGARHMLSQQIAREPCSIGWSIMSQAAGIEGLKPLAIAARGTTNFVMPSEQSFRDRTYPMVRNIYIYFDRKPGGPLEPKLREFLRFALSDEGQKLLADAGYLPLPAAMLASERAKLD
ncbi:phosphate transport system substrate-binding protein [Novosphingobium kunmingense]|uniref:Phosphate transport system substrate-binding protein n=1 Tax=Novosphingobium kunmingense TaxID=1211806 RepID=A0A2N0HJH7_9SPHN|nr:substrate-binding domain-containing protein [Novosphingobium kunmingense]PKB19025.1 phosphate transport system substrate-binding protein [Novosphingobium kunmingense]